MNGVRRRSRSDDAEAAGAAPRLRRDNQRTAMIVIGMQDNASRERVVDSLWRVDGVRDVSVSLVRARAVIVHSPDCPPEHLRRAVRDAGFDAAVERV
jgi:copper chaperone CopZ